MEEIKQKAIYFLSRRDHSINELKNKLLNAFPSYEEDVDAVINKMLEYHYLCDERFAHGMVRYHGENGKGPYKIVMLLKEKGVEKDIINKALEETEIDFFEQCQKQLIKKIKAPQELQDWKKAQKFYRFLTGRGFSPDHIQCAFDNLKEQQ